MKTMCHYGDTIDDVLVDKICLIFFFSLYLLKYALEREVGRDDIHSKICTFDFSNTRNIQRIFKNFSRQFFFGRTVKYLT